MAGGLLWRRRAVLGQVALIALALASCGKAPQEARPAWRDEVELACLRSGVVHESAYVTRAPAINGPGSCGALQPFHVSAFSEGRVPLTMPTSLAGRGYKVYAATLTCAMVPAIETWMSESVQRAAAAVYGQPVVQVHSLGSYSCRRMNNGSNTRHISEHAYADAIDISGFSLADGREVMVRTGWRGSPEDQEFLRAVFVGACETFHTVLGPGSDGHHEDHFHLDLMRHAGAHHICRPVIKFSPRLAPPIAAPVQPPVAPGQLREEPESDDPYAMDDAAPAPRGAVAAREAPEMPAPRRQAIAAPPPQAGIGSSPLPPLAYCPDRRRHGRRRAAGAGGIARRSAGSTWDRAGRTEADFTRRYAHDGGTEKFGAP